MTTIHLTVTTPVAPERIVRAFTDFTPQRLHTFPNLDPRYYEVHAVQATSAEMTEGEENYPERRNPMTPQEKTLYHQIHPLKLFTDSSAEVLSLYLFWKRKPLAGFVVLLVPPIIVSTLIIKWVDLEAYKQSAFGRYMRAYMTPLVVAVRLLGTVVTHLGAWYRRPLLIPLGLVIVLLAWLRGILLPKRTGKPEETEESQART